MTGLTADLNALSRERANRSGRRRDAWSIYTVLKALPTIVFLAKFKVLKIFSRKARSLFTHPVTILKQQDFPVHTQQCIWAFYLYGWLRDFNASVEKLDGARRVIQLLPLPSRSNYIPTEMKENKVFYIIPNIVFIKLNFQFVLLNVRFVLLSLWG